MNDALEPFAEGGLFGANVYGFCHFSIDKRKFFRALARAHGIIDKKSVIPALTNVKIVASSDLLLISSTNINITIEESVAAQVFEEGSLIVQSTIIYEIVKRLPDCSSIMLKKNKGATKLLISSGNSRFSIATADESQFPQTRKTEYEHIFKLKKSDLVIMFAKTQFAISGEEMRYYLNGIYLHADSGKIVAVATDGHRLAKVCLDAPDEIDLFDGVIIPKRTVAEIIKLQSEEEELLCIKIARQKIEVSCQRITLISKLINGKFPDYKSVIPKDVPLITLKVNLSVLKSAIERVAAVQGYNDKEKSVKFIIQEDGVNIFALSKEGNEAEELITTEQNDAKEELSVLLNASYITEALNNFDSQAVILSFFGGAKPVLIKDPESENILQILMPMRLA